MVCNLSDKWLLKIGYEEGQKRSRCAMWRAVILQAILDSVNNSKRTEFRVARVSAIKWIFGNSHDFRAVCGFAECSSAVVQKHAWTFAVRHNASDGIKKIMSRSTSSVFSGVQNNYYANKKMEKFFA